jgi:P27 family predicted phage terminase small subunit
MPSGRKPKPTYLKLVTGNPGKRPLNRTEPKPARNLPTAPDFLYDEAKAEWRRVAGELHRLGLLTTVDRAALAAYCQCYARWKIAERCLAEIAARDGLTTGLLVKTKSGDAAQNPLVWTANRAMADMVRYAAEFGMTPSSRTRLSGTPTVDTRNPFAEFTPQ